MMRSTRSWRSGMGCVIAGLAAAVIVSLTGCVGEGKVTEGGNPDATAAKGTLAYDRGVFSEMLEKHDRIRREFKVIDGGIEAVTESDDPKVAALIADHVEAMKGRLETGRRLRQWDPLYVAIFDDATKISLTVERTGKGVRVRETSNDPAAVALIRQHAGVVSGFAARGTEESALEHPVR